MRHSLGHEIHESNSNTKEIHVTPCRTELGPWYEQRWVANPKNRIQIEPLGIRANRYATAIVAPAPQCQILKPPARSMELPRQAIFASQRRPAPDLSNDEWNNHKEQEQKYT